MKKVSTVAASESRNLSQPQLTIGLDLGDRSSWYCVLDERGELQGERKVSTTAKAMREAFRGMPYSRIALETGTHSPWVSRVLSELGHGVIVAHARNVRLIGESRRKDDRLDARTLARLARIDPQLLSPVKHRSAQAQADRSPRVRMEGWRQWRLGRRKPCPTKNKRTDLTPTGLLMEGLITLYNSAASRGSYLVV
jgi:transposase